MGTGRATGLRVGWQTWRTRARRFADLPRGSRLAFVAALPLNPIFERTLHRKGTIPARELARRLGGHSEIRPSASYDVHRARRIGDGVMLATRVGPADVVCLPRSLTLWTLLRRRGVDAQLLVGVDPTKPDLAAHAWVRVCGTDINESPEHLALLHPFDPPLLG